MADMYTITFTNKKKSQYIRNEIVDIEYIHNMIFSNTLESKTKEFNLPCSSLSFDYLIGRISKADVDEDDYFSLADGIISLADYTVDIHIMIVAYELLNDIEIGESLSISDSTLINKYPNFFVYPLHLDNHHPLLAAYKKYINTLIFSVDDAFNVLISHLNRSQLLTICQFYNYGSLHDIVRFVNTWNKHHWKDTPLLKCWEDIEKLNLHFSLCYHTFRIIKKIDVNLLLVPFINSYLEDIDIREGIIQTIFVWKQGESIYEGGNSLIINVINDVIYLEAKKTVYDIYITNKVSETGTFRITCLEAGAKFTYIPPIIHSQNNYIIGYDFPLCRG